MDKKHSMTSIREKKYKNACHNYRKVEVKNEKKFRQINIYFSMIIPFSNLIGTFV